MSPFRGKYLTPPGLCSCVHCDFLSRWRICNIWYEQWVKWWRLLQLNAIWDFTSSKVVCPVCMFCWFLLCIHVVRCLNHIYCQDVFWFLQFFEGIIFKSNVKRWGYFNSDRCLFLNLIRMLCPLSKLFVCPVVNCLYWTFCRFQLCIQVDRCLNHIFLSCFLIVTSFS